jgi:hypothetical protein
MKATFETLEWTMLEQIPSVEFIHDMIVESAKLNWECCKYSAHIIAQEEAFAGELSTSFNLNVKEPHADFMNNDNYQWKKLSYIVRYLRSSTQLLAKVLYSSENLSQASINSVMANLLDTDNQKILILAEVARMSYQSIQSISFQQQQNTPPPPPPLLRKLLISIVRSSTSQQYVRQLFHEILLQLYRNVDRSHDKQPTSFATQTSGKGVEQTQQRMLRALLSNKLNLPPLLQATCCILNDAGFDASNFLYGDLICGSLRDTLFLPFIKVIDCTDHIYKNDMISGAKNLKEHLTKVAFVLERVFEVTHLDLNSSMPREYDFKNIDHLLEISEVYSHRYGPRLSEHITIILKSATVSFRKLAMKMNRGTGIVSIGKRGVSIKECDLMELCDALANSKLIAVGSDFEKTLLSLLSKWHGENRNTNCANNNNRTILCIPIININNNQNILQWGEIVSLNDYGLNMTWGDCARFLSALRQLFVQYYELVKTSRISFLSNDQMKQAKTIENETRNKYKLFSENLGELIHTVQQDILKSKKMHTLLLQQSSGMLLRNRSSTNLDDGLLPLYRAKLKPEDSIFVPVERESTVFLESAGVKDHKKHGDPLNVRSTKYIRGSSMNDKLRIQDRPHGWRSPVARTRMKKYSEAKEETLMKECSFKPELSIQRAAVASLLKFKEKANSLEVTHKKRPKWNNSRVLSEKDLTKRLDKAVEIAKKESGIVPEVYLSLN